MMMMMPRKLGDDKGRAGNLVLSIASCRNLVNCHRPYCFVKCGRRTEKSGLPVVPESSKGPSVHDDVKTNPKFGSVFNFSIMPPQVEGGRVRFRIEIRDDRQKLAINLKAMHAVGGFVDLDLDVKELMDPTSPFRDRWWLLSGVHDGEIHLQVSYIPHVATATDATPSASAVTSPGGSPRQSAGKHSEELGEAGPVASAVPPPPSPPPGEGLLTSPPPAGRSVAAMLSPPTAEGPAAHGSPGARNTGGDDDHFELPPRALGTPAFLRDILALSRTMSTASAASTTASESPAPDDEQQQQQQHLQAMLARQQDAHGAGEEDQVFDQWGFLVDPSVSQQWRRLDSYVDLRQQRQMERWDRVCCALLCCN
jgi:hypothetical protein